MKHPSHNTRTQVAKNVEVNWCGIGLNYMYELLKCAKV
jgi:hypothetical protein